MNEIIQIQKAVNFLGAAVALDFTPQVKALGIREGTKVFAQIEFAEIYTDNIDINFSAEYALIQFQVGDWKQENEIVILGGISNQSPYYKTAAYADLKEQTVNNNHYETKDNARPIFSRIYKSTDLSFSLVISIVKEDNTSFSNQKESDSIVAVKLYWAK